MVGVLGVVHQGRTEASSAYQEQAARSRQRLADVKKRDAGVRDALVARPGRRDQAPPAGRARRARRAARAGLGRAQRAPGRDARGLRAVAQALARRSRQRARLGTAEERQAAHGLRARAAHHRARARSRRARGGHAARDGQRGQARAEVHGLRQGAARTTSAASSCASSRASSRAKPGQDGEFELELWPGETLARPGPSGARRSWRGCAWTTSRTPRRSWACRHGASRRACPSARWTRPT